VIGVLFGLELSAPISMIWAPLFIIDLIYFMADERVKVLPPSLNESGVKLQIPTNKGFLI
jgi:hypothetical protein